MAEIDRYYAYQSLFTGRTAVPKSEILKKLEISSATFKRDLAMFRDRLNTPILYDRDLGGYKLENSEGQHPAPTIDRWRNCAPVCQAARQNRKASGLNLQNPCQR